VRLTQHDNPPAGHLGVLDALRGACALWVLLGHTADICGAGDLTVIRSKAVAVDIFMFISGFLMTYHYRLREDREPWSAPSTWLKFYTRRFFRLAPVYYLLLIITLIFRNQLYNAKLGVFAAFPSPYTNLLHLSSTPPPWSWGSVLSHFTFLFGFIPKYCENGYLPDWSIGLEMQFYLFFPFLILLFRRFGHLGSTIACLALWWYSHQLFGVYIFSPAKVLGIFPQPSFLPLKLECFVFGILVAEAFWFRFSKNNLPMMLLVLVAGMTLVTNPSPYFEVAILFCVFFIFSKGSGSSSQNKTDFIAERILNSRFVQFMADTSYSVYLIHVPLLWLFASIFATQPMYVSLSPMIRFGILLGIMIGVTYPLAFILFKSVEQPGIRVGQRVIKNWGKLVEGRKAALT